MFSTLVLLKSSSVQYTQCIEVAQCSHNVVYTTSLHLNLFSHCNSTSLLFSNFLFVQHTQVPDIILIFSLLLNRQSDGGIAQRQKVQELSCCCFCSFVSCLFLPHEAMCLLRGWVKRVLMVWGRDETHASFLKEGSYNVRELSIIIED